MDLLRLAKSLTYARLEHTNPEFLDGGRRHRQPLADTQPHPENAMTKILPCLVLLSSLSWSAGRVHAEAPSPANVPQNLRVPPLAFDEKSLILVWDKPSDYAQVVDYAVYLNGKKLGMAAANNTKFSPAKKYIDTFYADDPNRFHARIQIHNYTVEGLKPNTPYTFTVRAVDKAGKESGDSPKLVHKTMPAPKIVNVATLGAVGDGKTLNTDAIQAAIAGCPKGGKVFVPKGVWKTGALFLKSDMTLEIAEGATLLGSDNAEDYPLSKGYRLYPYAKHDRPPSLLNLLAPGKHEPGTFENVRIVGKGIIDGNGWKRAAKPTVIDESGALLPVFAASTNQRVQHDGRLAKAQFLTGVEAGLDSKIAYGQRRSSLFLARGVRNLYLGDLTVTNPAFHGLMVLQSENVTIAGVTHLTYDANNADGIEFGNSRHGVVFNNFFDTGDDAVNFAAGTGSEAAAQPPQQDTWLFNNYFRQGHGAVVIGSHTGAWVEKILAEDNVIMGTDVGLRCKSTVANGGGGRDILFRDNALKDLNKLAFAFTLEYMDENAVGDYLAAKTPARFHTITVRNVTVDGVRGKEGSLVVKGDKDRQVFHEKLVFDHIRFLNTPPASLQDLRDSVFRDVSFQHVTAAANPFVLKNTTGLRFEGSTPLP